MKARTLSLFAAFALVMDASAGLHDCLPQPPADQDHLVFQYTPFLSDEEVRSLDAKLVQFARESSNQIAVIVLDTLCGDEPYNVAHELMRWWGIGKAKQDNGVVILVKPTGPPGGRKVFIATGYGLEGAIPDATCSRIVNDVIIPAFKEGHAFAGLDAATDDLMKLAVGEYNAKSYGKDKIPWGPVLIILFIVVISILSRLGRTRRYARTNSMDFWTAFWLLNQASRRHRGTWGGFTGGGGGWSGGGGGGFGGFGGGMGGGGGAGGSW